MPRWLMAELPTYLDSVGRHLGFAASAVSALSSALLSDEELTLQQWVALTALWRQDGISVSDLAAYTTTSLAAASRLLGRMEDQGLVERRAVDGDRRTVNVFLTPKSEGMRHLLSFHETVNKLTLDGFSAAERKQLVQLLDRVAENARSAASSLREET